MKIPLNPPFAKVGGKPAEILSIPAKAVRTLRSICAGIHVVGSVFRRLEAGGWKRNWKYLA